MRDLKTGAIIRGRFTTLKLDELSAVDMPAQEGAKAVIMKRADICPIHKYYDGEEGAKTFSVLMDEAETRQKTWALNEKIWPAISAVTDSIRSIIADSKIGWATRQSMLRETIEGFLAEVSEKAPEFEAELTKYLDEGVQKMSDIEKKLEAAEAALAKAQTDIDELTKARDEAVAKAKESDDKAKESDEAFENLKKSSADEILKVGDTEIRKSVVGDGQFAMFKAQQEEIAKGREAVAMASFEKRADAEFSALPGTSIEKAAILKAADAMPDGVRASFDKIMKAAQEMAKGGFEEMGHANVEKTANIEKAKGDFMAEVRGIAKRDGIAEHDAIRKARTEHPALWTVYKEAEDARRIPA